MNFIKSEICKKYSTQINNEIAAGEYAIDYLVIKRLKNAPFKNPEKFGLPLNTTMYDLLGQSIKVLPTLRFIYLMSLLEAFAEEYIAERLSVVDCDSIKENKVINELISKWDKNKNGSTSFYNISFLNYLFSNIFRVDFNSKIHEVTFEAGELRRCIVHDDGIITKKYADRLTKTIAYLNLNVAENVKIYITKALMGIFIEDTRIIINLCDY